jgi:acetyl-CoA acyltransferase
LWGSQSWLQAIALAADRIRSGGAESMSMIPMTGNKLAPNPWIVDNLPQLYMGMGLTAECVRKQYGVTREQGDLFALEPSKGDRSASRGQFRRPAAS